MTHEDNMKVYMSMIHGNYLLGMSSEANSRWLINWMILGTYFNDRRTY